MAKKTGSSAVRSKKTTKKAAEAKVRKRNSPKKSAANKPAAESKELARAPGPRRLKQRPKLPNVWSITLTASKILWRNKRLFISLTLIYGLLTIVLAEGLSSGTNVATLKHSVTQVSHGHISALGSGLSVFVTLVGSAGGSGSQSGGYQTFLTLIGSLSIIWALRQVFSGVKPRIRDAYYQGMYPLIPFILVLLVIIVQLIPLLIGATIYSVIISNGIAVHLIEKIIWTTLFGLSALLTFYWLTSSLFALYIVALPDMTPIKALRSARQLVRGRRWTVMRKIICLPIILLLIAAIIMLPFIILLAPVAQYVFFLLSICTLAAVHSYMYTLYRELLNE